MLNWGIFFFFNPASHFFFLLSTPSSHSRCLTFEGGEGEELVKEGEKGGLQTLEELSGLNSDESHRLGDG